MNDWVKEKSKVPVKRKGVKSPVDLSLSPLSPALKVMFLLQSSTIEYLHLQDSDHTLSFPKSQEKVNRDLIDEPANGVSPGKSLKELIR